jgi:hypothetical protein
VVGSVTVAAVGPLPGVHALIKNVRKTIMPTEKKLFLKNLLFIVQLNNNILKKFLFLTEANL